MPDLVYTCQYGADPLRIALLFEHKSAPRTGLAYQLLQYMMGIWRHNHQQDQAMMPVVAMVLYHGKRSWRPGDFWSCFEALPVDISGYIPNFDYLFMDLSCYTDKQLKVGAFKAAAVKIGLLIMKHIYDQDNLEKALREYIEIGRQYFTTPNGLEFLRSVIQYLFQVTDIAESAMAAAIAPAVEKGGDEVMTTAQRLREEGFKIGCQKGRQEGRQEGWQEGRREGSQHLLSNLIMGMRKRGLDAAQIAENLGLDQALVTRIINRESVEIPLHLLGQGGKND